MCELFAVSSKFPTRATFSLEEFSRHGGEKGRNRDGWGFAFYEGGDAQIYRETGPAASSEWMYFLRNHQHLSQCIISHIRKATIGEIALRNTQPFSRELAGFRHVFCHNGTLADIHHEIKATHFSPIGETDSEYAFCFLLAQIENLWSSGRPELALRAELIQSMFDHFAELGPANFLYSDGEYLYAYANRRMQSSGRCESPGMYYLCRDCNHDLDVQPLFGLELNDTEKNPRQTVVLFASVPLSGERWLPLQDNQLIVAANGRVME
jgi:predicted glutamine amidotransferase